MALRQALCFGAALYLLEAVAGHDVQAVTPGTPTRSLRGAPARQLNDLEDFSTQPNDYVTLQVYEDAGCAEILSVSILAVSVFTEGAASTCTSVEEVVCQEETSALNLVLNPGIPTSTVYVTTECGVRPPPGVVTRVIYEGSASCSGEDAAPESRSIVGYPSDACDTTLTRWVCEDGGATVAMVRYTDATCTTERDRETDAAGVCLPLTSTSSETRHCTARDAVEEAEVPFDESAAPSGAPTTSPSASPTPSPTMAPSTAPSSHPSEAPSAAPTEMPSASPTPAPSSAPSRMPTAPTAAPSGLPTLQPSATPTEIPSSLPSHAPSALPTPRPTASPTPRPTPRPSFAPTSTPTAVASPSPSQLPSASPSMVPSVEPSAAPSAAPTARPSLMPSRLPSGMPSMVPSGGPSLMPSGLPSMMPSGGPSLPPSYVPSLSPSGVPSPLSSEAPSDMPSLPESFGPSLRPSLDVSLSPSMPASSEPTPADGGESSLQPSAGPSGAGTSSPTSDRGLGGGGDGGDGGDTGDEDDDTGGGGGGTGGTGDGTGDGSEDVDDGGDSGGGGVCFGPASTVQVENLAEPRRIRDLAIGDRVLTANAAGRFAYADVVFLPHAENEEPATFLDVTIAGKAGNVLSVTGAHLVVAADCATGAFRELVRADALSVGRDCLMTAEGAAPVMALETTVRRGIYSAVTEGDFLVVDGVVASPFAISHAVPHAYYEIHRLVYRFAPSLLTATAGAVRLAQAWLVAPAVMVAPWVLPAAKSEL